jgi:tryptophanyl-tRNA synthetase
MTAKEIILTGDRPTGKLHIGHLVGSLKSRVHLQVDLQNKLFVIIADQQALTDRAKELEKIRENLYEVALDYLAVGLDPKVTTIFIQSQVPELAELTMYYMNLVSIARLHRNPTVKTEIEQKGYGESVPAGFFVYPISQVSDITAFKATKVPVGNDQKPMIEQTREVVRTFNHTYQTDVLVEPAGIYPDNEAAGRLLGLDGNAKMSKSLNNGIFLADDADTLQKKVMSMYTDPNHLRVEDPGQIEGNMVFHYLDVFGQDKDQKQIAQMKEYYQHGGLGDVKVKRYLLEILNRELEPIRKRRKVYAQDLGEVKRLLKEGSEHAQAVAAQTLSDVKKVMGINYFS